MNDETEDLAGTALSLFVLLICGAALFLLAMMIPAPASDVCLTKKQARHLWPRSHIYWYSGDHCWSNRHGPPRHIKIEKEPEPKKIKGDPVFNKIRAEEKLPAPKMEAPLRSDAPMNITEDGCCWPVLTEFDLRWAGDREQPDK